MSDVVVGYNVKFTYGVVNIRVPYEHDKERAIAAAWRYAYEAGHDTDKMVVNSVAPIVERRDDNE